MATTTILLLLVAAASSMAFSPADRFSGPRRRRDVASGSHSGSGATSFAGSSSSSSSSGGPGYSTSISSRSGVADSGQGLNSVNPGGLGYSGAGDFSYPNYANPYPGGAGYVPADFQTLFMQYLDFMQRMSQQQAYAPNYYSPDLNNFDNSVAGGYNQDGAPGFSDISSRSGFGADNFGVPQGGFYFPGETGYGGNAGGDGQVSASASASLSPRGGFGSASISPPPQGNPELGTRMGNVPPSGGGGSFSVFTSSSSGSSDVNGVKKSFKDATSVINDNGKVTTYHVSDP